MCLRVVAVATTPGTVFGIIVGGPFANRKKRGDSGGPGAGSGSGQLGLVDFERGRRVFFRIAAILTRSFKGKVCGACLGEFSTTRENVKPATGRGHARHHRGCQGGSSGGDDLELGADSPDSGRFLRGKIEPDEIAAAAAGVVHFPSLSKFTHANFHGPVCERVFRRPSKQSVKAGSASFDSPQKRAHVCECVALAVCVCKFGHTCVLVF